MKEEEKKKKKPRWIGISTRELVEIYRVVLVSGKISHNGQAHGRLKALESKLYQTPYMRKKYRQKLKQIRG